MPDADSPAAPAPTVANEGAVAAAASYPIAPAMTLPNVPVVLPVAAPVAGPWKCSACTFENDASQTKCGICDGPRGNAPVGELAECAHVPFGMVIEVGAEEAVVHPCTCPVCLALAARSGSGSDDDAGSAEYDESQWAWDPMWDDEHAGYYDYSSDEYTPEMLSPNTLHGLEVHDSLEQTSIRGTRRARPKKGQGKGARKDRPAFFSKKVRYHIRVATKIRAEQAARAEKRAHDNAEGNSGAWMPKAVGERRGGTPRAYPSYHIEREHARARFEWRHARRRSSYSHGSGGGGGGYSGYNREDFDDGAAGHQEPLLSAAELGMDEATYRLLLDMQYREITANDYQVISELDNSVATKSLNKKKLVLFPTATVRIQAAAADCGGDEGYPAAAASASPTILLPGATPHVSSIAASPATVTTVVDSAGVSHIMHMTDCPICACGFEDGEVVRKLPCSHAFHQECIDTWFDQSTTCPNCITEPATPAGELPFDFSTPCVRCQHDTAGSTPSTPAAEAEADGEPAGAGAGEAAPAPVTEFVLSASAAAFVPGAP